MDEYEEPNWFRSQMSNSLKRIRFAIGAVAIASTTLIGGVGALSVVAHDDGVEATADNRDQRVELKRLSEELATVRLELGKLTVTFNKADPTSAWSGFCSCVVKDNRINDSSKKYLMCPSSTAICDKDSRDACEKLHPEYEC